MGPSWTGSVAVWVSLCWQWADKIIVWYVKIPVLHFFKNMSVKNKTENWHFFPPLFFRAFSAQITPHINSASCCLLSMFVLLQEHTIGILGFAGLSTATTQVVTEKRSVCCLLYLLSHPVYAPSWLSKTKKNVVCMCACVQSSGLSPSFSGKDFLQRFSRENGSLYSAADAVWTSLSSTSSPVAAGSCFWWKSCDKSTVCCLPWTADRR